MLFTFTCRCLNINLRALQKKSLDAIQMSNGEKKEKNSNFFCNFFKFFSHKENKCLTQKYHPNWANYTTVGPKPKLLNY